MKHARDLVLPCALCAMTFAVALAMAVLIWKLTAPIAVPAQARQTARLAVA